MIESEDEICELQKTFSENIIQIKTYFDQYIYFRPSQVLSISVNKVIENSKPIKSIKTIKIEPQKLIEPQDDFITDIE